MLRSDAGEKNVATGKGLWSSTTLWSLGHVPAATECASIAATAEIVIDDDATIRGLEIAHGGLLTSESAATLSVTEHALVDGRLAGHQLQVVVGGSLRQTGMVVNQRLEVAGTSFFGGDRGVVRRP